MPGFLNLFVSGLGARGETSRETWDWARNFAFGRLLVLAAAFCLFPFALVLPATVPVMLPVLVAALASGMGGLLALQAGWRPWQVLAATAGGLLALLFGLRTGLAPATAAVAVLAMLLDCLAMPAQRRPAWGWLAIGGFGAALVALAAFSPMTAAAWQPMVAVALLPLAPLATLAGQMNALRAGASTHADEATRAALREEVMLAAADAAIVIVERGGHVVDATARASTLFSSDPSALFGRGLVDRVLIADRPAFLTAISDAAISGRAHDLQLRLAIASKPMAAPDYALFSLCVRPAFDGKEQATIRIAPALSLTSNPAPRQDRAELFASLSHEIRTPMNAIFGFAEILANPQLCPREPEKVAEYANIILHSARDSFAVTRAVVDLMRVETTAFNPAETVDVEEMLRAIIQQLTGNENEGSVTSVLTGAGALSPIEADPRALRMLLSALVEGLATAVGMPARIESTLSQHGLRPVLELSVMPAAEKSTKANRTAFLGVIRVLTARLAQEIGAQLRLEEQNGGWHARLVFAGSGAVVALPTHEPVPAPTNIVSLRKSA